MLSNHHTPVLLAEVIQWSTTDGNLKGKKVFDGTLGGGGYTSKFVKNGAWVWATDLDEAAIARSSQRLEPEFETQTWTLIQANFADGIADFENEFFDTIVLDLGYSSNQLEEDAKGFSYLKAEQNLDLRFDTSAGKPAWQKLNEVKNQPELRDILYRFSGEQLSSKIATALMEYVSNKGVDEVWTVGETVEVIRAVIPVKIARKTNGILSRIWQALRIWVNAEFESLERFLSIAPGKLRPGGRLIIVSFHSLEDKIVTRTFRQLARPIQIDNMGNTEQKFKLLTKKAITPTYDEVQHNPRSRSAMMRVLEKRI